MTLPRTLKHLSVMALLALAATAGAQTQPTPATAKQALPPGHPAMPSNDSMGGGGVPSGHMDLNQIIGDKAGAPATDLAGMLNVTFTAANGSSTANEPVTVEFVHRGATMKKLELKTDGLGKVTVPGVPLMPPVDIVLSITHAGLAQRQIGPDLTIEKPVQDATINVYESTEDEPAWTIAMQHMIVQWSQDGTAAVVTEMFAATNPADKAWIGKKSADGKNRVTFSVPLPPNADQVELGGFDDDATNLVDGKLVTATPLHPGRNEFRMTYTLPAKDGNLELPITASRTVGNLIVFVPADQTQIKAVGLNDQGAVDMGMGAEGGKVRMFRAENLAAGATASLSIKGIKAAPAALDDAPVVAKSEFSARNVAIGGAFLMVLAGAAMMLMKKPQPRKE